MEIHKYTDILGKTLIQPIYEGRMVLLVADGEVRVPTNDTEAALAKFMVAWPVDNRKPPLYQPYPAYSWALRQGFDRVDNTPWSATVYTTYPGLESVEREIPSGADALLYDKGEFTVSSGAWIYSTSVVAGNELEVNTTGSDAGKLQIVSTGTAIAMCTAVASDGSLRFRTYGG